MCCTVFNETINSTNETINGYSIRDHVIYFLKSLNGKAALNGQGMLRIPGLKIRRTEKAKGGRMFAGSEMER